jgi:hypothetical protein
MGSERFKGSNAAHDAGSSSKSTAGGWEGIYANLSLSALTNAVDLAAKARQSKSKKKQHNAMLSFCLTELLQGSLTGSALTGMVTCLSQSPRNGDETYLSLNYSSRMSKLLNVANPQPQNDWQKVLKHAQKQFGNSKAIVARGVQGKYQALRQAEVNQWRQTVDVLESLGAHK